jgi:hypothetical protein
MKKVYIFFLMLINVSLSFGLNLYIIHNVAKGVVYYHDGTSKPLKAKKGMIVDETDKFQLAHDKDISLRDKNGVRVYHSHGIGLITANNIVRDANRGYFSNAYEIIRRNLNSKKPYVVNSAKGSITMSETPKYESLISSLLYSAIMSKMDKYYLPINFMYKMKRQKVEKNTYTYNVINNSNDSLYIGIVCYSESENIYSLPLINRKLNENGIITNDCFVLPPHSNMLLDGLEFCKDSHIKTYLFATKEFYNAETVETLLNSRNKHKLYFPNDPSFLIGIIEN